MQVRDVLVLLAAAAAGTARAQLSYNENDLRRLQRFGACETEFPTLRKLAMAPATAKFGDANMASCNTGCQAENVSDHNKYMRCFSCCDAYYGQTERSGSGEPMLPAVRAGRHAFAAGWKFTTCADIKFDTPYQKSLNVDHIHLQVVVTHNFNAKITGPSISTHDGVFSWVEWIKHSGFRACVAETAHHDNAHDANLRVDWISWSNDDSYRGVTGTFKTEVSRNDVCKQVAFGLPGDAQRTVSLVTTNHRNWGSTHDPIMTWVKETTGKSFTPCARETGRNDDWHDKVEFDYATFPRGAVCPGQFIIDSTQGLRQVRWYTSRKNIRCQRIEFPVAFPAPPIVAVSLHADQCKGCAAWVETVAAGHIVACLQPRTSEPVPNLHKSHFDYVAVSSAKDRDVTACMRGSCPTHNGHYCGGQGQCAGSKCHCLTGRSGAACQA
jgi:hypothetical protein